VTPPSPPIRQAAAPLLLLLVTAAAGWLYTWAPDGQRVRPLTAHAVDYYHEYADALLAGHLHLARAPDPRLVALPDPLDPEANREFRRDDLSYHEGRYYLYHGIVPALVLLAPVRAATGMHLGLGAATALFAVVGTVTAAGILLSFRRRAAPRAGPWAVAAALLAVVAAGGVHVVLHGATNNQLPIASAYAFSLLGLAAAGRAVSAPTRALGWLAAASLAFGLAIGSRANFVFAAAVILPLAALLPGADPRPLRGTLARLAAAGLPAAAAVAGLLALNVARFGDPFEFGMRLMLGAWDQRRLPALDLSAFGANVRQYLAGLGDHHALFPFVTAPSWQALGLLPYTPFVLGAGALLAFAPARDTGGRRAALLVALLAGVNFAVLTLLPSGDPRAAPTSANARYVLDFSAAFVLLGAFGVLAAAHRVADRPGARRLVSALAVLAAGHSALAAASLHLGRFPEESFRPLTRALGGPLWWTERMRGVVHGPVLLDVRFPAAAPGAAEPLLAIGDRDAGDLVYVVSEAPNRVRVGLLSVGREGPLGPPVAVEPDRVHRVEIHVGPLQPPAAHPLLAGLRSEAVAALTRRVLVRLDGRTVLDAPVRFTAPAGAPWSAGGTDFLLDRSAPRFTGRIEAVARGPVEPPAVPAATARYGAVRLRLRLPERTAGTEPLLATGVPQAGDVLHVTTGPDGRLRFGLDHWGHRGAVSSWVEPGPGPEHELEVTFGALLPPEDNAALAALPRDRRRALKERLRVVLDGRVVLDAVQDTYDSSPHDVVVGRNPIGASSCGYAFSGEILAVERLPLPRP
jgi:hypothetical protein